MNDDNTIMLSALVHYLYCPRRCALVHTEQQWAENRYTAEGQILHQQADTRKTEKRKGVHTVTAMPLNHDALGIAGIADVVEFHEKQAYPVEYKRGRPKTYLADEVQLCAQALCLEHMLGQQIPEGALFYGQTRRRKIIAFDETLRTTTQNTIAATRALLDSGKTPTAEYNAKRCDTCSLIDDCQPKLLGRPRDVNRWLAAQLEDKTI